MTTHHDTPLRPEDSAGQDGMPPNPYAKEAQERWGHTDAYKQSQERVKKMTKEDWQYYGDRTDVLMRKIVAASDADKDPASDEVQELIAEHYDSLHTFYEPNLEMYRGLGSMYVDDPRFAATYDKYKPGLAVFMRDAMHAYCDVRQKA